MNRSVISSLREKTQNSLNSYEVGKLKHNENQLLTTKRIHKIQYLICKLSGTFVNILLMHSAGQKF